MRSDPSNFETGIEYIRPTDLCVTSAVCAAVQLANVISVESSARALACSLMLKHVTHGPMFFFRLRPNFITQKPQSVRYNLHMSLIVRERPSKVNLQLKLAARCLISVMIDPYFPWLSLLISLITCFVSDAVMKS